MQNRKENTETSTCIESHLSMTLSTCLLPSTPPLKNIISQYRLGPKKENKIKTLFTELGKYE